MPNLDESLIRDTLYINDDLMSQLADANLSYEETEFVINRAVKAIMNEPKQDILDLKQFMEDNKIVRDSTAEFSEKWEGHWVAVFRGEVVAANPNYEDFMLLQFDHQRAAVAYISIDKRRSMW